MSAQSTSQASALCFNTATEQICIVKSPLPSAGNGASAATNGASLPNGVASSNGNGNQPLQTQGPLSGLIASALPI